MRSIVALALFAVAAHAGDFRMPTLHDPFAANSRAIRFNAPIEFAKIDDLKDPFAGACTLEVTFDGFQRIDDLKNPFAAETLGDRGIEKANGDFPALSDLHDPFGP